MQYEATDGARVWRYTAGALKNSERDTTVYVGVVPALRLGAHADIGLFLGALTYPSYRDGLIPAALPVVAIGTERARVNAIYIPQVTDNGSSAVLFQFVIGL